MYSKLLYIWIFFFTSMILGAQNTTQIQAVTVNYLLHKILYCPFFIKFSMKSETSQIFEQIHCNMNGFGMTVNASQPPHLTPSSLLKNNMFFSCWCMCVMLSFTEPQWNIILNRRCWRDSHVMTQCNFWESLTSF